VLVAETLFVLPWNQLIFSLCSYWGRRAFERHFKEWRHVNGMKALGIPNNKDFFEVTQIADAQALWRTIQVRVVGGGGRIRGV
jgi:splicing factor 3A subunit 3